MSTENEIVQAAEQTPEQIAATAALTDKNRAIDNDQTENTETEEEKAARLAAKPEKTPDQREIERLRRGIDRKTRQLAEERARRGLNQEPQARQTPATEDDGAPLSLTRAQIKELVTAEAAKLAPTLRDEALEVQRRTSVVQGLAKTWGQERFDELSSDLDDAFGGLTDSSGKPKPAIEAVFEADAPAKVIEWLADPDNADEAERISRLSAVKAGQAIAKLEAKLTDSKDKPQASKALAPLETVKSVGKSEKRLADLSGKDFAERRRRQIASRQ